MKISFHSFRRAREYYALDKEKFEELIYKAFPTGGLSMPAAGREGIRVEKEDHRIFRIVIRAEETGQPSTVIRLVIDGEDETVVTILAPLTRERNKTFAQFKDVRQKIFTHTGFILKHRQYEKIIKSTKDMLLKYKVDRHSYALPAKEKKGKKFFVITFIIRFDEDNRVTSVSNVTDIFPQEDDGTREFINLVPIE